MINYFKSWVLSLPVCLQCICFEVEQVYDEWQMSLLLWDSGLQEGVDCLPVKDDPISLSCLTLKSFS